GRAEDAHQPDEAGGGGAPGVVVGDHRGVVADAQPAERGGEVLRGGQRVPAALRGRGGGEGPVDVGPDRGGPVPGEVGVAAGAAVQVPADVDDGGGLRTLGQAAAEQVGGDDGRQVQVLLGHAATLCGTPRVDLGVAAVSTGFETAATPRSTRRGLAASLQVCTA